MKILLAGANGFVGHKIYETYKDITVVTPSLRGLGQSDITRIIEDSEADVVINAAAIADMRVCQKNPEASYLANVQIPLMLAKASKGRKLILFSSDQVYNGSDHEGPYSEGDEKPANVYAKHKLEMEQRVLDLLPDSVMLRAEWMYDYVAPKEDYFWIVKNIEDNLKFSSKEYRGVTYVKEVAENIKKVIELPGGAYNYGSETDITIYEVTKRFAEYLGKNVKVQDAEAKHNLWLNCNKARKYGVEFSNVIDGLIKCEQDSHEG